MREESANALGRSLFAGAFFGAVAFAFVLVLDLVSPAFAPEVDFVLSTTLGVVGAGSVGWWLGVERPTAFARPRSAAVGALVGLVAPVLAFALNPSVYGGESGVVVNVLAGVIAAGILGLQGHVATLGLSVFLGALAGWSLAGWSDALRG